MPIFGYSSSIFLILLTIFVLLPLQLIGYAGIQNWINDWINSDDR